MINPDNLFRRDPKQEARILDSVMPSDFFPQPGQFFRIRWAAIADRSYNGCIWECVASQNHCVVGRRVLDTYCGLTGSRIGELRSFVAGDVIFYDCSEIWAEVQKQSASAHADPATDQPAA